MFVVCMFKNEIKMCSVNVSLISGFDDCDTIYLCIVIFVIMMRIILWLLLYYKG